jgi:demethylmenaquinone methyltransferase / 2-methoxy-6-polyprenyl-1,4-benzoquinol methylase
MAVVPYNTGESKKDQVADMFDNIAGNYDFLNRLLSGGIDIYWRKKALNMIKNRSNDLVIDIATGTGDLALEAIKILDPKKIIGVDISEGMLAVGKKKILKAGLQDKIEMRMGDSEKLLFDNNTFDTAIVSFGVRNFEDLLKGLTDIHRVLKPGGTGLIVEFSKPTLFPFKQLYWFYSTKILPTIGRLVSKDSRAYTYLPESVKAFPDGNDFLNIFQKAGFVETSATPLTFGICTVYVGKKQN